MADAPALDPALPCALDPALPCALAPALPCALAPALEPLAEPPLFEPLPALAEALPPAAAPPPDEPASAPVASFATLAQAESVTHAIATHMDERSIEATLHQSRKDVALRMRQRNWTSRGCPLQQTHASNALLHDHRALIARSV